MNCRKTSGCTWAKRIIIGLLKAPDDGKTVQPGIRPISPLFLKFLHLKLNEWYRLSVFSSYGNLLIALPGWDDQPVCRDAIIIRTNQEADVCKGNTNLTNIYNHKEPTYHNFLDPGWVFACPEWVALRLTWPCHYKKGQRLSHIQLNTVYSANSHSSELKFAQIH